MRPFKAIAKQNWVNKLKKRDWEEGEDPRIQGVTNSVSEVAEEFTKYYQMLYAKKYIDAAELRKVINLMEIHYSSYQDLAHKPRLDDSSSQDLLRMLEKWEVMMKIGFCTAQAHMPEIGGTQN